MNDDELTPSEKEAIEKLPKERLPGEALEERLVRSLHQRGILQARRRRMVELTSLKIAGAVAASIVFIVCGFVLGRWTGSQQDVPAGIAPFTRDEASVAASLQQAGTAYIVALENLASLSDTTHSDEKLQGREVALSTLYMAADQVTKIIPKKYLAGQLLEAIDISVGIRSNVDNGKNGQQEIWF
jgi:hypothetical protein